MLHNRRVTALVPIKAHSERIPNKSHRMFCGKPLYSHVLQTLDQTYAIDDIYVNTDSEEVLANAPSIGRKINVIPRPEGLRPDTVDFNRILEFDIGHLPNIDIIVNMHITSPLLRSETIAKALKIFVESNDEYDSLLSVTALRERLWNSKREPINFDPDRLIRTQDMEPVYIENCALFIFTRESFQKSGRRIGQSVYFFETPRLESVDIDYEADWHLAELFASYSHGGA